MAFINAPFREDKGRKVPPVDTSSHLQWDYLKDTRPEAEKKVFPVGKSDTRASKFKAGFYRRPVAAIPFAAERLAQEEAKQERSEMSRTLRQGALQQINEKNGNVLRPNEPVPGPPPRHLPPEPLFKSLRKFPERDEQVHAENHARQKVGASRFHMVPTPTEAAHRARAIVSRLEAQKGTTSVIGFGRSDLPTNGAVDNFKPPAPYTGADLISKPKLRPPPPGSVAAQRNVGQVSLTDASGGIGWGRRGDPQGQNIGSPRSQAQQQAPHRMATAGVVPPVGPARSRRNNFNNASSAGLLDAFNYPNVTNVWKNGAGTTSSSTWGRGGTASAAPTAAASTSASIASTAPPTAGGAPPATS